MTRVLTVTGLTKGFGIHHLGATMAAFEAVDFTLDAGQFLILRGPNGVGKSTLLRTIYRSYLPRGGRVLFRSSFGEVDLARAADADVALLRDKDMGFVTQVLVVRPRVAAEALVAEPLRRAGAPLGDALDQARAALKTFGVKETLWRAYPTTFSGGEQQKVNLARALIVPKRLLLLDEPTASLNAAAREALIARLSDLKAEGTAMIGVFHHPQDVAHLIDATLQLSPFPQSPQEERADVAL